MEENILNFIQANSPDGGFLQSEYWKKFQESVGRKTHALSVEDGGEIVVHANIVTHTLPVAGNYFYVPRGPILAQSSKLKAQNHNTKFKSFLSDLIKLANKNNIGWIRLEPANDELLNLIKDNLPGNIRIKKSAVDMQPREILVLDISKSEEEILAKMKQKTRYNIKLAQKRGVSVKSIKYDVESKKYFDEFVRLVNITAERDGITPHPEEYYCKMLEIIPNDILKLYVAEYQEKIIAANLFLFFGNTATYMHGASDNDHREVMAPYLLQWRAIQDAKKAGCINYDLGGIKSDGKNNWLGITRFKTGFAPETEPVKFPGCYDIILKPGKYHAYRMLQKIKNIF